ncbi:hypothetical protein LC76P1_00208 [Lysinibacillus phage LC76P1]|nr:hypothetical protein LC76P1_00208 [Lysinibacillus phage LC76P1]
MLNQRLKPILKDTFYFWVFSLIFLLLLNSIIWSVPVIKMSIGMAISRGIYLYLKGGK